MKATMTKTNPFRTPDGYFEALPERTMRRIRERERRRLAWRWAAAVFFVGCLGSGALFLQHPLSTAELEADNTEYIEDALDYSMINNMEIATYLTEAE